MDIYEETIARIKKAYLSSKNIDSVYEQLHYELKNEGIPTHRLYSEKFLRGFMEQMMTYLYHDAYPKMKTENFVKDPKKTIVLLNAIAIQKVIQQIKSQTASMRHVGITPLQEAIPTNVPAPHKPIPPPSRTLPQMSVPQTPLGMYVPQNYPRQYLPQPQTQPQTQQQYMQQYIPQQVPLQQQQQMYQQCLNYQSQNYQQTQHPNHVQMKPLIAINPVTVAPLKIPNPVSQKTSLSTPLEVLYPKKKKKNATSLKLLNKVLSKGDFEEHEWWHTKPEDEIDIVEEVIPHQEEIPPRPIATTHIPWKLTTITSVDRNYDQYPHPSHYIIPVHMENVVSIYLYSIDLPIEGNVLTDDNNLLYYSEDDEDMKIIKLDYTSENQDARSCADFLQSIADQMTEQSNKYAYKVTLNRHTNRVKISQILESGQARNRLHLYFEQTRKNCAEVLGFERKDYRDSSEYEGTHDHGLLHYDKRIHMMIDELSSEPLLTLKVDLGRQRKRQQFPDACIFYSPNGTEGNNIENMTISFIDELGNEAYIGKEDHTIVLKYYYVPSRQHHVQTVKGIENIMNVKDGKDDVIVANKLNIPASNEINLEIKDKCQVETCQVISAACQDPSRQQHIEQSKVLQDILELPVENYTAPPPMQHSVTISKRNRLPTLDI